MTSTKTLFANFICIGLLISLAPAHARSPMEIASDLNGATDLAVASYKSGGMAELAGQTKQCYEKALSTKFFCVYLDIASWHIDHAVILGGGYPKTALHEYFLDGKMMPRIQPILEGEGIGPEYLGTIIPAIRQKVNEKLFARK